MMQVDHMAIMVTNSKRDLVSEGRMLFCSLNWPESCQSTRRLSLAVNQNKPHQLSYRQPMWFNADQRIKTQPQKSIPQPKRDSS